MNNMLPQLEQREAVEMLLTEIENAPDETMLTIACFKIPSVAVMDSYDYNRLIRASAWRRIEFDMKEREKVTM